MNKTLRKLLYRNYWRRDRYRVYRRIGLDLLLNYANYIDRQLIIREPYESRQLEHFIEEMAAYQYDAFIDVGANFGLYSLIAAQSGRLAEVLAFEPDPRNHQQLAANILLNRLTGKIRVYGAGLSNRDTATSFLQENGRSTGQSRIEQTAPPATRLSRYTRTTIDTLRFDNHFSYRDRKLLVKIDVEGHEAEVIDGMRNLLAGNHCHLQVEAFDRNLSTVEDILGSLGYVKSLEFGSDRIFTRQGQGRREATG
jgi:FkbM family methyltransferase